MAPTTFYLVQHGEKEATPGDPPLTDRGRMQAQQTAETLRTVGIRHLFSSPQRRAHETARYLASALGLPIEVDARLRERMNWGDGPAAQTRDEFLDEWERASADRDFTPQSGESSRHAGNRLRAFLEELAGRHPGESVALVTHGGVTVDMLRTLFGDGHLHRRAPGLLRTGPQGCAITHLSRDRTGYTLRALASIAHLPPDAYY